MASKRSPSYCDGMWNDPDTRPNVYWLAQHEEHDRTTLIVRYDGSVGIAWYDGMTAGGCGIGLSRHARQA